MSVEGGPAAVGGREGRKSSQEATGTREKWRACRGQSDKAEGRKGHGSSGFDTHMT